MEMPTMQTYEHINLLIVNVFFKGTKFHLMFSLNLHFCLGTNRIQSMMTEHYLQINTEVNRLFLKAKERKRKIDC